MSELDQFEGKSGVYFISPGLDYDVPLVKVGLSTSITDFRGVRTGGLASRLASYLLCYPFGFYIYAVIETTSNQTSTLESLVHEYFASKNFKAEFNHSRAEEWFFVTFQDITATVEHLKTKMNLTSVYLPNEPVLIDTNGKVSSRPVKPMTPNTKATFELNMSNVPATDQRPSQLKRQRTTQIPFSLDEIKE